MTDHERRIEHHDMANQAKKLLNKSSGLTVEETGLLVAELKRQRYVNGQLSGGKGILKRERDDYKGRYYRMLEGVATLQEHVDGLADTTNINIHLFRGISERLEAIGDQPEGPVTPEEKAVLFGVEHRARRQEAANFEVGKEIAAMIRRGTDVWSILSFLESKGLTDEDAS